jgi:serine/threonine protein kinase
MHLKEGSFLQGGRYRIERMLGQGGFGITYLGMQTGLNRKVAIKEFFMKEYCNREEETSHVSVPSMGSKDLVERFRQKFVKEAQTISEFSCPNIIRIYDVFEENGTAYYVMEYHGHGSLSDLVKHRGKLKETEAVGYIHQVAEALRYIHERNINHLDVKPGNVLLDDDGRAVLIDFGMSKRYDADGEQTSTTPVGISHGYAPLEQYKKGGVGTFSPATDIYSLGATLYKLVTGITPPDASEVDEDGLSSFPNAVSDGTKLAIRQAMNMKRKDRPQSVDAFLSLLDTPVGEDGEETFYRDITPVPQPSPNPRKWLVPLILCLMTALCIFGFRECRDSISGGEDNDSLFTDTLVQEDTIPVIPSDVVKPTPSLTEDKNDEYVPVTCAFYVSTLPSGAVVYVDGKKIGKSPIDGKEISRGKHTVKLVLDGYEPFSKQYTFGDKPVIINESLVAVPAQEAQLEPVEAATTGSINGHAWVDLGLSVKWATMNVGAGSPSDYGDYFAWGEVHPKSEYTDENSRTFDKSMGVISGNSQYDAARYHWGSSWRLPTQSELQELIDKCRWSWTEDGHKGYKIVGPNGNGIFLPAAGYRYRASTYSVGAYGYYWSGSPVESGTGNAYNLRLLDGVSAVNWDCRLLGRSVRPVSD